MEACTQSRPSCGPHETMTEALPDSSVQLHPSGPNGRGVDQLPRPNRRRMVSGSKLVGTTDSRPPDGWYPCHAHAHALPGLAEPCRAQPGLARSCQALSKLWRDLALAVELTQWLTAPAEQVGKHPHGPLGTVKFLTLKRRQLVAAVPDRRRDPQTVLDPVPGTTTPVLDLVDFLPGAHHDPPEIRDGPHRPLAIGFQVHARLPHRGQRAVPVDEE